MTEIFESDFDTVRTDWERLMASSHRATPFQNFDWISNFVSSRLAPGAPLILACRRDGEVIGIVPLQRVGQSPRIRRLLFLGGDYNDIICPPDEETVVVESLLSWLKDQKSEWDMADLRSLHHDSAFLAGLPEQTGLLQARIEHQNYPVLQLPATWEELSAGLSKSMRDDLKQSPRRMAKRYSQIELRRATSESLEVDLQALIDLHQTRWQGKGEPGLFAEEHVRLFHGNVTRGFLDRGDLYLYVLRLDGRPVGAAYALRQGAVVAYYLGGFDPTLSAVNPQKVVLATLVKDCISDGVRILDFLKGEEDYKRRWGAQMQMTYRVVLSPKGLKAWASMTGLRMQPKLKKIGRRLRGR